MMEDNSESNRRNFVRQLDKYTLAEKQKLGECVEMCKKEYDAQVALLKGKTRYDAKRKKFVVQTPKQSFLAKAVRTVYSDLADAKHNDSSLEKALKLAKRCHEKYLAKDFSSSDDFSKAKIFRETGAGRKPQAVEVRQALFQRFIGIRGVLKGRLPKNLLKMQAESLYNNWLTQQVIPAPESDKLKFSNKWVKGWLEEYNVSLKKPNKRFAIAKEDRLERLQGYLKNIWTVRKYFMDTYEVDPPIINADQMPLHRNESAGQRTLSFKSESTYVKENYMLSRERITCFTQLCSDPQVEMLPEFVFKGKGTCTQLQAPEGVNFQWAPKGSYHLEQMLQMVNSLPNRFNMFTQKGFAIYVLDDYSVHLMPEIREALFKKGYILVIIGGGITGDIQINDTHCHAHLKAYYREEEMKLVLEQLQGNPNKIPSPSRNEIMAMLIRSWKKLDINVGKAFKSLFVTNALDGSEDYLVSDQLFSLIGPEMVRFRSQLVKERPIKTVRELLRRLIPPKGVHRSTNIEGIELLDCEGEELDTVEDIDTADDDIDDAVEMEKDDIEVGKGDSVSRTQPNALIYTTSVSMSHLSSDPSIVADSEFLDKLYEVIATEETSKLFTPYILQLKAKYKVARRSLKRRLEEHIQQGKDKKALCQKIMKSLQSL